MTPNEARGAGGGKLRLRDFEKQIRLRPITIEDYPALVAMQERCYPGMQAWGRDQIASQIERFPDGQLCLEYEGRIVASSSSLIVEYDRYEEWHDWKLVADSGYIRNHAPDGDTLYGIEIMVDPDFRGMKLARRLYDARKALCRDRNLARIIIGGRIPGYGAHASEMSAREYVERVIDKTYFDPVLTAQLANGFTLKGLIADYMPSDEASRGYATICECINYDYQRGAKRRYHHPVHPIRLTIVQY